MTLGLTLFGAPTVQYGDGPHALNFERRAQLLVFLALKRGWVGRAELAAMLWPDQQSKLAYTNLRKALFRLQSYPWAKRIEANGNALRFDVATDVAAFEAALGEQRLADAQTLRRGDLLVGFDDHQNDVWSSWLGFERDRLRVAWRSAVEQHLASDCDPRAAIDLAARLLEDDALDEVALRAYMTWLARTGQGARARQAYRDFAGRLLQELGLTPSAELNALNDSIGAAALGSAATVGAQPVTADDGFVGRAVELRRIAELIKQDDCRLLTVTGPGGVGKTRLARRAMAELAAHFADGAVFTPLEDIASPRELGGRLARELGITLKGSDEPLDQVLVFLRARHTLLVLDNFEQIVDASPAARAAALGLRGRQSCCYVTRAAEPRQRMAACRSTGCPVPNRRIRICSSPSTRRACSCGPRSAYSPHWFQQWKLRRLSISAARSKVCRSRWSWRRHGRACCRVRQLRTNSAWGPNCCRRSTQRSHRGMQASRWYSTSPGAC